jgi:hypothetical protein
MHSAHPEEFTSVPTGGKGIGDSLESWGLPEITDTRLP